MDGPAIRSQSVRDWRQQTPKPLRTTGALACGVLVGWMGRIGKEQGGEARSLPSLVYDDDSCRRNNWWMGFGHTPATEGGDGVS